MRRVAHAVPLLVLALAVAAYLTLLPKAVVEVPRHEQCFTLPPQVLRIVTLQFKEVVADVSFLNALTFLGGTRTQPDTHRYLPEQYAWLHSTLKNSVTLDAYFLDPYLLMNSALIWDRYKLEDVNGLIAKGSDTRTWDHQLPFFVGFNYYYFLNNSDKSFMYLREASKREGGNPFYDSLASRVAFKANKTEVAISYLEEQISQAKLVGREKIVESLIRRLEVLKGIRQIEVALESYRKLFGKLPATIVELKSIGLLAAIPVEPFGGSYYIDSEGRVRSDKDL